ncbi:asparagine synthetase B [Polaribacter pacificus]|uniref:asparagine synthase (glutamine-hydrolyzing) n=1 Tax=Polaribacter pacificus TaxID=1775173 RepID=A0A917MEA5_9FLAO|nr:asparagine synthase (glutamine-hydrolyzing) [Polaribacter pacificus]GGG99529.1 asparagine synthetase B [Polaribacter pacificus]
MCGISGIIGSGFNRDLLSKMIEIQQHRGPDSSGEYVRDGACLGHNRLSIIDLSEAANQPFFDTTERYIIVFNGEIYNYLELKSELEYNFKTNSDTEVLLAAYIKWGKDCLHKLNGMFSFAIWDSTEKKLFAARDRFGVKPLYYHHSEETFYFASEIKTLHAAGVQKAPNEKVWASYFVYGSYGMPNETFWKDIHQLPGGHWLEFENNQIKIEKWYVFEEEIKKYQKKKSYDAVKSEYTALLKDSIELRFRSDVPVGFNVSGGLDSSALLAFVNLLGKEKSNINAYTFFTNDKRYDELPWVEEMISLTKNPLKRVLLQAKEVKELAKKINSYQDEPYGGLPTLAYSKIFQKAREDGVLVLLDGQGMDEQWAGYDYYVKKTGSLIQGVNRSPFRKNVLSDYLINLAEKPAYPKPFEDDLLNLQFRDLFYTKIPRALRFNDRISMTYGTELREPFLDYRLVELAFSQPIEYKIKAGVQKSMLREIVSEYLSDSISYAPKRPLQTPQREWLCKELKDFVWQEINDIEHSKFANWFDIKSLKQEYNSFLEGDNDSSFHIWQWINFNMLNK